MLWVDYTYYTDEYKGGLLDQEDFPKYSQEAQDYIDYVTLNKALYAIASDVHTNKIKRAICTVSELYFERDVKIKAIKDADLKALASGIKSETVLSHSVTYNTTLSSKSPQDVEKEYDTLASKKVRQILLTTGLLYRGI